MTHPSDFLMPPPPHYLIARGYFGCGYCKRRVPKNNMFIAWEITSENGLTWVSPIQTCLNCAPYNMQGRRVSSSLASMIIKNGRVTEIFYRNSRLHSSLIHLINFEAKQQFTKWLSSQPSAFVVHTVIKRSQNAQRNNGLD